MIVCDNCHVTLGTMNEETTTFVAGLFSQPDDKPVANRSVTLHLCKGCADKLSISLVNVTSGYKKPLRAS